MCDQELILAVKKKAGIKFFEGPSKYKFIDTNEDKLEDCKKIRKMFFSYNGQYFCWVDPKCIYLYDMEKFIDKEQLTSGDGNTLSIINVGGVKEASFSPLGTYLIMWQDPNPVHTNLQIWDVKSAKLIHGYKVSKQYRWELKWTQDEKLMARFLDNRICFYETPNFEKFVAHTSSEMAITSFTISPRIAQTYISVFTRGSKGQPSFVKILEYPHFEKGNQLPSKSSFAGDDVQFYWNPTGQSLLALLAAEVDKTNESYYGQQFLLLLTLAKEGDACRLNLPKDGPIHSLAWCPVRLTKNIDAFVVTYGHMLSKATLYDSKGDVLFDFGTGRRNGCHFAPQGHILALTGSGNIQGNVEFWEMPTTASTTCQSSSHSPVNHAADKSAPGLCCKLISQVIFKNPPTSFQWCPDGEHFCAATTTPRMRVDNGFLIYHYTGSLIYNMPLDELYEVQWRPIILPSKPITYTKIKSADKSVTNSKEQLLSQSNSLPLGGGKYVPPHLRGAVTDGPGKGKAPVPVNPMAAYHQAQLPSSNQEKPLVKDADKRIRNIRKRLKQIEELKEDLAKGKKLDPTQVNKIQSEDKLIQELEELEI